MDEAAVRKVEQLVQQLLHFRLLLDLKAHPGRVLAPSVLVGRVHPLLAGHHTTTDEVADHS